MPPVGALCYSLNIMDLCTVGFQKKQYAAAKLQDLAVEKAKILLLAEATHGNDVAKELLNLLRQTSA
jgi:hypothetical protein